MVQSQSTLTGCAVKVVGVWPLACWNCGFESRQGHGSLSIVSVVSYQVEVLALGWSLFQRSTTDCGVPECDREASIMRGPGPTMAVCAMYINSKIFAHSSLLQPQGNGSFYADSLPPIIIRQRGGRRGCRPVKQILLKNWLYLCYITSNLLFYVLFFRTFTFSM